MKSFFRKLHRWLGLLMALQIIAWMSSGFYFSLFPIEQIRGEHLTAPAQTVDKALLLRAESLPALIAALDRHFDSDWELTSAEVINLEDTAYWRIEGQAAGLEFTRLVGAEGQGVLPRLSADEARDLANRLLLEPGRISEVEWVEEYPDNLEFRGRPLPVWRVAYSSPESLSLYIDPWTGELLVRRTDRWRLFDFFWMLHVMDYETRDDFNHPLLQVAALLGLVIALSGVVFWALTTRLFRRRRIVVS